MMAILFCNSPSFHKTEVATLGHHSAMPVLRLYLQLHPNPAQQGVGQGFAGTQWPSASAYYTKNHTAVPHQVMASLLHVV